MDELLGSIKSMIVINNELSHTFIVKYFECTYFDDIFFADRMSWADVMNILFIKTNT